jgi:hypothetical protein
LEAQTRILGLSIVCCLTDITAECIRDSPESLVMLLDSFPANSEQ